MIVDTDPTIRECALSLIESTRAAIEREYLDRRIPHYVIREQILFREVPGWIKRYGKPTADLAVRAINSMSLAQILTKAGRMEERRHMQRQFREFIKETGRDTWVNRLSISLFGTHFWVVAVVAVGALWAPSDAEARGRQRYDLLHACAAAPERERHAMGCWRFGPSELMTARPWDDPPPRPSWDNRRPWEDSE